MGILLSKEISDLAIKLFHIHHSKSLKWDNCSQDLRQWYLLEADHLVRNYGLKRIKTEADYFNCLSNTKMADGNFMTNESAEILAKKLVNWKPMEI